ncbi:MAG: hypothetical protein M1818_006558 [Claussenomyces sp. TS43310]|nr:MAG: hypothetical protein M1818_006558 [Claussenomyces sp. TS43310]
MVRKENAGQPGEEGQEVKRKRIARRKKIRCDGNMPACTHCLTHGTECVFSEVQKKRRSRKGARYIEALEERLARMESLLTGSAVLGEGEPNKARSSNSPTAAELEDGANMLRSVEFSYGAAETSVQATSSPIKDLHHDTQATESIAADAQAPLLSPSYSDRSRMMDVEKDQGARSHSPERPTNTLPTITDSVGTSRPAECPSIGQSSAGFSIFSPKALSWVVEKTGDMNFRNAIHAASQDETRLDYWRSDAFSEIFGRPVFREIPSQEQTFSIVGRFFRNFNSIHPLFSEADFMAQLHRQFSTSPYESVGWWASLNVVLAITLGLQALDNAPPTVNEVAWDYLRNALAVLTELTLRSTDLYGVQALLGMALFLQGTADPRPTAFLITSAMRLSHTLGLHKKELGYSVDPYTAEQRQRVFWIAYRLDKDLCLRSGLPLVQDDDDMNLDLPSEHPSDGLGKITLADGHEEINIFRLMTEFAVIEGTVHKRLYSTKASKQSDEDLLNVIDELDSLLEKWKESIPEEFQPEYEIKDVNSPLSLHIIVLHFAYYNCLNIIHRTSIQHSYWTSRSTSSALQDENGGLSMRALSSAALCRSAARASIRLVRCIPIQDIGFVWRVLYFPVSAFIALFVHILQDPSDARARSDLRLMVSFVTFLGKMKHEKTREVLRIWRVCSEFERVARNVVESGERRLSTQEDGKGAAADMYMERRMSVAPRNAAPLTPESSGIGAPGVNYNSVPSYSNQNKDPELRQYYSDLASNKFPVTDMQPIPHLFSNWLTMPLWNDNTCQGTFLPDDSGDGSYDFGVNMNVDV